MKRLDEGKFGLLLDRYKELLEISKPILNMILFSTSETGFIILLMDASGVNLYVTGDVESLSAQENYYNTPGMICDENLIGARASTLALREGKAISLCGSEHFFEVFHNCLCYAAPILDHNQNVYACISLATSLRNYNPQTMSMLLTAAETIGSQLQKRRVFAEQNYLKSLVYSICETLPDGIIALDLENSISYINQTAENIVGLSAPEIKGRSIFEFIHKDSIEDLSNLISNRKQNSIPLYFLNNLKNSYLCRNEPLLDHEKRVVGLTLFLASDEQIIKGGSQVGGNRAHYRLENIKGNSPQIKKCIELARKIAKKANRILITGESGTGKELFAQAIHNASPRKSNPFVAISCASIPRELVEAELFGYVAGSFTGANKSGSIGKFELANRGTLFLDEIGSLPLEAQGKLLRALQQSEIVKVGGKLPIPINVNVIPASNVELRDLVKSGMFREDLYYRINSVELIVPPLRKREGDTELLIKHFVHSFAAAQNRKVTISTAWMESMMEHIWSGNVRELEHACEYSLIVCSGDKLELGHLPPELNKSDTEEPSSNTKTSVSCDHVDDVFRKWLTNALDSCSGNIVAVSKKYGISRSTLYRKARRFGIDVSHYRENRPGFHNQ